jgi:hypothetical protein
VWSDKDSSWWSDFDDVSNDGFDDESTPEDFPDDALSNDEASAVDAFHVIDDCNDATSAATYDAEHEVNDCYDDTPHEATVDFATAIDDDNNSTIESSYDDTLDTFHCNHNVYPIAEAVPSSEAESLNNMASPTSCVTVLLHQSCMHHSLPSWPSL